MEPGLCSTLSRRAARAPTFAARLLTSPVAGTGVFCAVSSAARRFSSAPSEEELRCALDFERRYSVGVGVDQIGLGREQRNKSSAIASAATIAPPTAPATNDPNWLGPREGRGSIREGWGGGGNPGSGSKIGSGAGSSMRDASPSITTGSGRPSRRRRPGGFGRMLLSVLVDHPNRTLNEGRLYERA